MLKIEHGDIVKRVHNEQSPTRTLEGALAFLLRLLPRLPAAEGAGLLLKPAGENIVLYQGVMVSAGRICYPDGTLYKVLTDIPTTNGPQWMPDGMVDASRYIAVIDAGENQHQDGEGAGNGAQDGIPSYESIGGDALWDMFGQRIFEDYARYAEAPNPQMMRHAGRVMYDALVDVLTNKTSPGEALLASIDKHQNEPVNGWVALLQRDRP